MNDRRTEYAVFCRVEDLTGTTGREDNVTPHGLDTFKEAQDALNTFAPSSDGLRARIVIVDGVRKRYRIVERVIEAKTFECEFEFRR